MTDQEIIDYEPFDEQVKLMAAYAKKNPNFKTSLAYHQKEEDKVYLRLLFSYLEEEIIELEEQYTKLITFVNSNPEKDSDIVLENAKFFDELADVYHFLIEVLIVCGISKQDIVNTINSQLLTKLSFEAQNPLDCGLYYAGYYLTNISTLQVPRITPHKRTINLLVYDKVPVLQFYNPDFISFFQVLCYRMISYSKMAIRKVPFKPWKVNNNKPIDIPGFQADIVNTFISFCIIMISLHVRAKDLKVAFKIKNDINLKRILDNY